MTEFRKAGEQPMPGSAEPTGRQPVPPASGRTAPASGFVPPGPASGQPVTGFGPHAGYPPQPPSPSPPAGNSRTGLIIAGVLALVAVLTAGVAIGFLAGGGDSNNRPAALTGSPTAIPSTTPPPTTTPYPAPAPGSYSMSGITNACDLVDPVPLHRWSSTPAQPPYHAENPPGTLDGAGDMECQIIYQSLSSNGVHPYQVGIELEVEFTAAGAAPAYDEWKHTDTATAEPGHASGDAIGIGVQSYWATWVKDQEYYGSMTYVAAVQDSNVSVRVRLPVLRQLGEPQVSLDELGAIARDQVQRALDGLKAK